jgi:hypothetical protein
LKIFIFSTLFERFAPFWGSTLTIISVTALLILPPGFGLDTFFTPSPRQTGDVAPSRQVMKRKTIFATANERNLRNQL